MMVEVVSSVEEWLINNYNSLNFFIDNTECYKWRKWSKDKSIHVFPCVCDTRNSACKFVETYHSIWQVNNALTKEDEYIEALIEYSLVIDAKGSLKRWLKSYEELFQVVLLIDDTIKVSLGKNSLEYDVIQLPREELRHLLKFKEVHFETKNVNSFG